jgi:hypothetical protein
MSGRRCSSLHRFSEVERLGLFFCLMNLGGDNAASADSNCLDIG